MDRQLLCGIKINRKDKQLTLVGLDIIINGFTTTFLKNEKSLEFILFAGVHIIEIGSKLFRAWNVYIILDIAPVTKKLITIGTEKIGIISGEPINKEGFYYHMSVRGETKKLPEYPVNNFYENYSKCDFVDYAEQEKKKGGLTDFVEYYYKIAVERRQQYGRYTDTNQSSGYSSTNNKSSTTHEKSQKIVGAFATLGLETNATLSEVKIAYRELVNIHHPDKGGNTKSFLRIQTAYQTLVEFFEH